MLPCLIFEDEHLLVINKPAGMNTHAPSPHATEGLYDWLRHREPRWATLAIIHRLDKETSGVIVFAKTSLANRSLTEQFTQRAIHKKYLFLTDRPVPDRQLTVRTALLRVGERYVCRPAHAGADIAETRFRPSVDRRVGEAALTRRLNDFEQTASSPRPSPPEEEREEQPEPSGHIVSQTRMRCVEAEPLTGRTHQIRVHAAEQGFPILGDVLYGGTPGKRVCLHASELTLKHPGSGKPMTFHAPVDFTEDSRLALRSSLLSPGETNAFRVIHGASDGWPGCYVDKLGDWLLLQTEQPLDSDQRTELERLAQVFSARGAYHKTLTRRVRETTTRGASPSLVLGEAAPERFVVSENAIRFELSFDEGYSVGLFLDQRDNRRRFLTGHVAAGFAGLFGAQSSSSARFTNEPHRAELELRAPSRYRLLNTFSYTCGFSVCAAKTGAHTTSLDLSKKYLDWGKRNFALNGLDASAHDFIYGDVFDWLRRLAKKGRKFDVIALDPPTFSQSKESGVFRATKDYGRLVLAALSLLEQDGVLFASTNAAEWAPEAFLGTIEEAVNAAKLTVTQSRYIPQPADFPVSRNEPAYLKTVWLRMEQR
jgi:23S rRNA (cytosine1962-C5)-methyltransferase